MNITYRRDYIPPPARTGVGSDLIYELNYYNDRKDDCSEVRAYISYLLFLRVRLKMFARMDVSK